VRYRNRLFAVQHLVERQSVERHSVGNVDVIGFAAVDDRAVVQIFPLRGGKMVDRHSFHLENVGGQDVTTVLEAFGLEYYGSAPSVPPQIVVPRDAGDLSALAAFLSERRGARVEVRTAERGEKRRLQELADENAHHVLETDQAQSEQKKARRVEALEELRESLNLESLPIRVECYDISHAMGQDPVASMVVFQDALPKKSDYRKFGIKTAGHDPDDFAAMAEVISRRFARLSDGTEAGSAGGQAAGARPRNRAASGGPGETHDASFATAPNLVVIDGGKGQLSAALAAMQAYDLPRVAVIALAKRIEEVFVPGQSEPIVLSRHNPGLQLLQRIRDEAHRFALGFHRQRRETRGFGSIFDDLEGVGPSRRRALLQHFGSVEEMLAATADELEGVPGVPPKTARRIYDQLHKAGRG
jgi:excinuclease ABC subunit C